MFAQATDWLPETAPDTGVAVFLFTEDVLKRGCHMSNYLLDPLL